MKTSILIGLLASSPWLAQAVTATGSANPWEMGKDITFAGLVWFLIGYSLPKLMATHRDERAELAESLNTTQIRHEKERASLITTMDSHQHENRELLTAIAKQHAESTKSGHAAAAALAAEIRSVKEAVEQD